MTNLALKKTFVRKIFYRGKKNSDSPKIVQATSSGKKRQVKKRNSPSLIPAKINLNWKNIKMDREVLSGNGVVILSSQKITTPRMKFRFLQGGVDLSHNGKFALNSQAHSFNMQLKKLDISRINAFFPSPLQNIKGQLNGSLSGRVVFPQNGRMTYNIKTDFTVKQGSVQGLKIGKKLNKFIAKLETLPGIKGKIKKEGKIQFGCL